MTSDPDDERDQGETVTPAKLAEVRTRLRFPRTPKKKQRTYAPEPHDHESYEALREETRDDDLAERVASTERGTAINNEAQGGASPADETHEDALVDEASKESFPASDPPAF